MLGEKSGLPFSRRWRKGVCVTLTLQPRASLHADLSPTSGQEETPEASVKESGVGAQGSLCSSTNPHSFGVANLALSVNFYIFLKFIYLSERQSVSGEQRVRHRI